MKAIIYTEYGSADVLRLEDIDKPAVGHDDVLVRIRAGLRRIPTIGTSCEATRTSCA